MVSIKQAGSIINGVFMAAKNNDNSLLIQTVESIENTISNPFFRALNSYGEIGIREISIVLKLSAALLNKYYEKIPLEDVDAEGSQKCWDDLMTECDNILEVIERDCGPLSREYGKRVVIAILSLLENEYMERRKQHNEH